MLAKLRAQTKFWMWIVAGAFILTIVFAWGMDYSGAGSNPVLGKVNGSLKQIIRCKSQVDQRQLKNLQTSSGST